MSLRRRVDALYAALVAQPAADFDEAVLLTVRLEHAVRAMAVQDGFSGCHTAPWTDEERLKMLNRIRSATFDRGPLDTLPPWPPLPADFEAQLAAINASREPSEGGASRE